MTLILSMVDYEKRRLPKPGYLDSLCRRSDSDCVNRPHLDAVLRARRERDAHRTGEPNRARSPRASDAPARLPGVPLIERLTEWWLSRTWPAVAVCLVVCAAVAWGLVAAL